MLRTAHQRIYICLIYPQVLFEQIVLIVHYTRHKQNGKVDIYLERTTINGKKTNIWRNANGCIYQSFYDVDEGGEKIRFYYDDEGNAYKYAKEGNMWKHKGFGREETRSIDGTLLYYEE